MSRVDQVTVRQLQVIVGGQLSDDRELRQQNRQRQLDRDSERQFGRDLIHQAVEAHHGVLVEAGGLPWGPDVLEEYERAVEARVFGAGQLQELLDDSDVENINVNGCDQVFVTWAGGVERRADPVAESDEELVEQIQTLAAHAGLSSRPFDPANPELDLRLPDGSRLSAVMEVTPRPSVSIRKNRIGSARLRDLVENQTLTPEVAEFLAAAVRARLNIMIAGAPNAGKTTLLRALAYECSPKERLVTVERALELDLGADADAHPNVVALEERLPNAEGEGAVSVRRLVGRSRRMDPSRVIVGEVQGDEVIDMLNAMSMGNDGSMSTIHANSARETPRKIGLYARQSPERLDVDTVNALTADALDVIVFMHRDLVLQDEQIAAGAQVQCRRVREIVHVESSEREVVAIDDLYLAEPGQDARWVAVGVPEPIRDRLLRAGWQPHDGGSIW